MIVDGISWFRGPQGGGSQLSTAQKLVISGGDPGVPGERPWRCFSGSRKVEIAERSFPPADNDKKTCFSDYFSKLPKKKKNFWFLAQKRASCGDLVA